MEHFLLQDRDMGITVDLHGQPHVVHALLARVATDSDESFDEYVACLQEERTVRVELTMVTDPLGYLDDV